MLNNLRYLKKKRPYFKTVCHIKTCYGKQVLLQRHLNIDFILDAYVHDKTCPIHDT